MDGLDVIYGPVESLNSGIKIDVPREANESLGRLLAGYGKKDNQVSPIKTILIAFLNGSYKKVDYVEFKHSEWIHFTRADGSVVRVNPAQVKYLDDVIE